MVNLSLILKLRQAGTWALKNPTLAACAVASAGGVAVAAAPVLVTGPILAGVDFNAGGVAAGIQNLQARIFISYKQSSRITCC